MTTKYEKHREIYEDLKARNLILFETVVGSQAHGTAVPTSDVDRFFVYAAPQEWYFHYDRDFKKSLELSKDWTGKEIGEFMHLLRKSNPTILENLFAPEDCHIVTSTLFEEVLNNRSRFLSKACYHSLAGYAVSQVRKATGQEKMQNWEDEKKKRKTPLDFCTVVYGGGSISLVKFCENRNIKQEDIGLVSLNNMQDMYALYWSQDYTYKGVCKPEGNDIRLSSIPKGEIPLSYLHYNRDGYKQHCKDFQRYEEWLANRNEHRYVQSSKDGKKYDSKNVMHLARLSDIAEEVFDGKGFNVRRPNRDELLSIRRGEVALSEVVEHCEERLQRVKNNIEGCTLAEEPPHELIDNLIVHIHRELHEGGFYEVTDYSATNKFLNS